VSAPDNIEVDQRTVTALPGFDEEQVAELRGLGLPDVQILALKHALLGVHACLVQAVPMSDVRDELAALQSAMTVAVKRLRRVRRSTAPAPWEALMRIQKARPEHVDSIDGDRWNDDLAHAEQALRDLLETVGWAIEDLPTGQRRYRAANPEAIGHIHRGLMKGWTEAHAGQAFPAFPFRPSINPTGPFRTIVKICYAAVTGHHDADPERAIKAYIRNEREAAKRREVERAGIGMADP